MPNTPLTATPYPAYTQVPDVPADMAASLGNLEKFVVLRFATEAARNAAITVPVHGMFAYITGTGKLTYYTGSAWVNYLPTIPTPATGNVSVQVLGGQKSGTANISFPAGKFTAPILIAQINSASGTWINATILVYNVSATAATIGVYAAGTSIPSTTSVNVFWIAYENNLV